LPLYNFHAHSTLSDGVLSPVELLRWATVGGYTAFAVTDHAGLAELPWLAEILVPSCRLAQEQWGLVAIPGVELTHLPPALIPRAARAAKDAGLEIVVVHGETPVEPVEPGTNVAALGSPDVDVLGHPGLLTQEEAALATDNDIFVEISSRRGHSLANGLVVRRAVAAGASLLLDSDAHAPDDLWDEKFARTVLSGAGVPEGMIEEVLWANPKRLLTRLGR
jgi:putative hydrolase